MNALAPRSPGVSRCLWTNQNDQGSLSLVPGVWRHGTKTGCQACWARLKKLSAFCKMVRENLSVLQSILLSGNWHFLASKQPPRDFPASSNVDIQGTGAISSMVQRSDLKSIQKFSVHFARDTPRKGRGAVGWLSELRSWWQAACAVIKSIARLTLHGWMIKLISQFLIDVTVQNKMGKY